MKSEKNAAGRPEENGDQAREIRIDELDRVTGTGNPFEEMPRVPTNPIDSELREGI